MKKPPFSLFLLLTVLFCAFTLGFFIGRNQNHETVFLSALSAQPAHALSPVTAVTSPNEEMQVVFPVNINTADLAELTALPGIGEMLAQRILDHRALNGPFSRPEELMQVNGIGPGKLEPILDLITIGG